MDRTSPNTTATSHGTPPTTQPPDPPDPPPPAPPHHRRHTRYSASTIASSVPPPHVVINTRRRRSPHRRQPQSAMSASPPAVAGPSTQTPGAPLHATPQPPPPHGQDHDRMETDEEDDPSDSELDDGEIQLEPQRAQAPNGIEPAQVEDVIMDTTPDHPPAPPERAPPPNISSQASQAAVVHIAVDAGTRTTAVPAWVGAPPGAVWDASTPQAQPQVHVAVGDTIVDSGLLLRQELRETDRAAQLAALAEHERQRAIARREREDDEEEEGGSDSDESMDEPDHPFWAHLKPDTSAPDENELAAIEEGPEISALDHEYWEKQASEPLDDPEYVPSDVGRIAWTVTANHGNSENPNREEIMRSPSVLLGGLYWNIKYYPRGNDGTDYMSVYIECSPRPYEDRVKEKDPAREVKAEEKIPVEDPNTPAAVQDSAVEPEAEVVINGASDAAATAPAETENASADSRTESPEVDMIHSQVLPPKSNGDAEGEVEKEAPWSAAAQISCVVYNPDEPRVFASQKSKHQYYNDNPDWGWTRFHGPWSEIHNRRRYQRKPLLQKDTLAFTVYIQVVEDHTKSLWWHPSESRPNWDSMALLNLRGLKAKDASALAAAMSAWVHLGSLVDSIISVDVPDRFTKAGQLMKPALNEFQDILFKEGLQSHFLDVSLTPLASIMSFFYGTQAGGSKDDVVMTWSNLRRILNLEANNSHDIKTDLFGGILMLMQPDPFDADGPNSSGAKFPSQPQAVVPELPLHHEPASVQETIDLAFQHRAKAFRLWESPIGDSQDMPAILQIELHRQSYDDEKRKWKKLTHKIEMNETVNCNGHHYTLYGMIVHRGGLDYNDFSSVLRPEGPGSRWLKYAGDSISRSVEVLTTKQAVTNHEGGSLKESAPVAYIAIYVRSDQLSKILSPSFRQDILRKAQTEQKASVSEGQQAQAMMPKATPFRVGKRDWCTAFLTGNIHDTIREYNGSYLDRSFYRTEYNPGLSGTGGDSQMTEETVHINESEKILEGQGAQGPEKTEVAQKSALKVPVPEKINVFVKKFDGEKQEIVDFGTVRATGTMPVIPHLREQLGISKDESWDFYHEHALTIGSRDQIRRSATFSDLSSGPDLRDGILIIAQRRPSKIEIKALEEAGKCATPMEHSVHLTGDYNPHRYSSHLTHSHFIQPYLSVPLSHGRPHGIGTHITLSGSAYTGPFSCGRKAGPNAVMHYANGTTYNGDWSASGPHGHGIMYYRQSGNVYTGSWENGRRKGEGIMQYKVSDEQLKQCWVCYEKPKNSVFLCGHMVACEACAKQLDICPICRDPIKGVVRVKGDEDEKEDDEEEPEREPGREPWETK